jgi:hypothetical protein
MFVIPCFKERPIKAYSEGRKIKANRCSSCTNLKKKKGGDKEMLLTGNKEDLTCRSKEKAVGLKKKKKKKGTATHVFSGGSMFGVDELKMKGNIKKRGGWR